MPPGFHHPRLAGGRAAPYSFPSLPVSSVYPGQAIGWPSSEDALARKQSPGAVTGEAQLAPRARGHRSLVTKRDLQAYPFARERDLSLAGNAQDLIDKVEHALARIDGGGFGRCEACGDRIEAERLDALPYATLCLADARRHARPR